MSRERDSTWASSSRSATAAAAAARVAAPVLLTINDFDDNMAAAAMALYGSGEYTLQAVADVCGCSFRTLRSYVTDLPRKFRSH